MLSFLSKRGWRACAGQLPSTSGKFTRVPEPKVPPPILIGGSRPQGGRYTCSAVDRRAQLVPGRRRLPWFLARAGKETSLLAKGQGGSIEFAVLRRGAGRLSQPRPEQARAPGTPGSPVVFRVRSALNLRLARNCSLDEKREARRSPATRSKRSRGNPISTAFPVGPSIRYTWSARSRSTTWP